MNYLRFLKPAFLPYFALQYVEKALPDICNSLTPKLMLNLKSYKQKL